MLISVTAWLVLIIGIFHYCGGQEDRQIGQGRWQDNIRPKLFAHLSSRDYQSFSGILLNDPSNGRNSSRQKGNSLRYVYIVLRSDKIYNLISPTANIVYGCNIYFFVT